MSVVQIYPLNITLLYRKLSVIVYNVCQHYLCGLFL